MTANTVALFSTPQSNGTFTVLSAEQETMFLSSGENMQVNTS